MLKVSYNFFKNKFLKFTAYDVYTDGSHKGRWGAWAYVVVKNGKKIDEYSRRVRKTDSHHMEFQAAIEALSNFKPGAVIRIHTDSRVLIQSMNSDLKRPPTNPEQVEQLKNLVKQRKVTWHWVKAHSGVIFNERCDELCIRARENTLT